MPGQSALRLLQEKVRVWFLIPVALIAAIPGTLIEPSSAYSPRNFALWFLIKVLSLIAMVIVVNASISSSKLDNVAKDRFIVGFISFSAGSLIGIFTHYSAIFFDLPDTQDLAVRTMTCGIFSSIWVVAIFISNDSFAGLYQRRAELISQFFELDGTSTSESAYLALLREKYSQTVESETSKVSSQIEREFAGDEIGELDHHQFISLIEKQLRQLDLLIQKIRELENLFVAARGSHSHSIRKKLASLRKYLRLSFEQEIVHPLFLSLTLSTSLIWPLIRIEDLSDFWFPLLSLAVLIFYCQSFLRVLSREIPAVLLNFVSIFATAIIALSVLSTLSQRIIAANGANYILRFIVLSALVTVLTSLFHLNRGFIFEANQTLDKGDIFFAESKVAEKAIRGEVSRITADWLQHVHGNIKPRLYAASLTIQQAIASENHTEYIMALNAARELLVGFSALDQGTERTHEEELDFRVNRWEGIVEITTDVQGFDYRQCHIAATEFGDVIEEGISNAVRHGKCSEIAIMITAGQPVGCTIEIRDNGEGIRTITPGLGSSFFDTVAAGNWRRTRDSQNLSTVLTLHNNP